jgi:hypothetical protein
MCRKIILGGIAGGVAMWLWSAVSWMALPWHASALLAFQEEATVERAVVAGAPQSGMYLLPYPHDPSAGADADAQERAAQRMFAGPTILAAVRLGPSRSFGMLLGMQLLIYAAGAAVGTALLLAARLQSYGARVLFFAGIGLAVAIVGHLPAWNWWSFSPHYTLVEVADSVIGWTLAGLAVGKIAAVKQPRV